MDRKIVFRRGAIFALLPAMVAVSPVQAQSVVWKGEGRDVVVYNSYNYGVQCTTSFDMPNGVGGLLGNRRNVIVNAGGRSVAATGNVMNFRIERCAQFPPPQPTYRPAPPQSYAPPRSYVPPRQTGYGYVPPAPPRSSVPPARSYAPPPGVFVPANRPAPAPTKTWAPPPPPPPGSGGIR